MINETYNFSLQLFMITRYQSLRLEFVQKGANFLENREKNLHRRRHNSGNFSGDPSPAGDPPPESQSPLPIGGEISSSNPLMRHHVRLHLLGLCLENIPATGFHLRCHWLSMKLPNYFSSWSKAYNSAFSPLLCSVALVF